jgi:beta-glucosidase
VNDLLPLLADGQRVIHQDINSKFVDDHGNLIKDLMPDLLHPQSKGYEVWISAIKPTIDRMLKRELK